MLPPQSLAPMYSRFAEIKLLQTMLGTRASESASDGKVRPIGLEDPNPAGAL